MALRPAVESPKWLGEKRQIVSAGPVEQAFPALPLLEGDAEMSRVQRGRGSMSLERWQTTWSPKKFRVMRSG